MLKKWFSNRGCNKTLLALLVLANSAAFAGIRLSDGDLLMEGDSYLKLSKLGKPAGVQSYDVGDKYTGFVKVYEYSYEKDGGIYVVTVVNGKVTNITWSR